jgi:hypothetical protein
VCGSLIRSTVTKSLPRQYYGVWPRVSATLPDVSQNGSLCENGPLCGRTSREDRTEPEALRAGNCAPSDRPRRTRWRAQAVVMKSIPAASTGSARGAGSSWCDPQTASRRRRALRSILRVGAFGSRRLSGRGHADRGRGGTAIRSSRAQRPHETHAATYAEAPGVSEATGLRSRRGSARPSTSGPRRPEIPAFDMLPRP